MLEPLAVVPTQLAIPEAGGTEPSEHEKLEAIDDLRTGVAPFAGVVIVTVGFCVSIFTAKGIADEPLAAPLLPTPSLAVHARLYVPSTVRLRLPLAAVGPLGVSVGVKDTGVALT